MPQNPERIVDHLDLFKQEEYRKLFKNKREQFEGAHTDAEVERVSEWTKSWEYREKNFARQALTINPAKGCQPVGAMFAALGVQGTLPFVQGSQGCVAYFRTHLSRHYKEPCSAVSSSMTEDAAVFGGLNNMIEGLEVSYKLYKPKMIAVCTTCMAEVIGDDSLCCFQAVLQLVYYPFLNIFSFLLLENNDYKYLIFLIQLVF